MYNERVEQITVGLKFLPNLENPTFSLKFQFLPIDTHVCKMQINTCELLWGDEFVLRFSSLVYTYMYMTNLWLLDIFIMDCCGVVGCQW